LHIGKAVLLKKMVRCEEVKEQEEASLKNSGVNTDSIKKNMATMKDAETQTCSKDESSNWNGAQSGENIALKKLSLDLRIDLGKARDEFQMLKMQLEHACEQSKVASMAYKTMEHDYNRLRFIFDSQKKDNTLRKDALLRSIQHMLNGTVL
jgi:hypothetical protein